jgi:hypothetical protein
MMAGPAGDSFGLRESPSADPSMADLTEAVARGDRSRSPWRRLLEWSPTSAPVALLLLSGIALGPRGINLLSAHTLSLIAPAIPVALAALGVLVALSIGGSGRTDGRRVFVLATLQAGLTLLVVAGGIAALALSGSLAVTPLWTMVLAAGICAASSITLPLATRLEPRTAAARLGELGVLVPIVAGGIAVAWLRGATPVASLAVWMAAAGLTLALALAVWLLLTSASSETEERVLTVSALLLVGGVSDALSQSALLMGTVAGALWHHAGRRPAETISRDVLFFQHPLLVLVLLTAGASATLSIASLALGVAYLVLRVVGQLAGGLLIRRASGVRMPADLGVQLLPPGVFGVAFALNLAGVVGDAASLLLAAVVLGTMGSEVVAALLLARKGAA